MHRGQGIAPTLIVIRVALSISSDHATPVLRKTAQNRHSHSRLTPATIDSDLTAARPPFLPALHSMGRETEESGRTIDLDEDYLEMKSLDLHGDGPFVAVAV